MIAFIPFFVLILLATVCSWLGCLVPFAAIGAAAAVCLRARSGIAVVIAAWALDQLIGFGYHQYPREPSTYAWGVAILLAALVAFAAARAVRARTWLALPAAFVAFELVLATFSIPLGGWAAYAPRTLVTLFAVNAAWFAAIVVAERVYRGVGFHAAR